MKFKFGMCRIASGVIRIGNAANLIPNSHMASGAKPHPEFAF